MTILIVTDNHLFSIAIRTVIKSEYPQGNIDETNSLRSAIEHSSGQKFQAMILDASAADAKDTALLGTFRRANPETAILVNLGEQTQFMYTFIRAGVAALFSNKSLPEEINEGLRRAEKNVRFVSADIQQQLLSHIAEKPLNQKLTKREEVMADLLVVNKSHQEIAIITGATPKSVGYYKRKIFRKLEVDNIVELAIKLNRVLINKDNNN